MSVLKQLCINCIELPEEIIDIIKSFAFNDIVTLQKTRKQTILNLIQTTQWSYRDENTNSYNKWIFWIQSDNKCPQYQIDFCSKCGNYKYYCSRKYDIIECNCK